MSDKNPAGISRGPDKNDPNSRASEELKARLIIAYEQALQNGLTPHRALAVMLEWAAEECARVSAEIA